MDNVTHGLLGLALGALRRPDGESAGSERRPWSATDKAVLIGSVIAAELPDLDRLWPAANDLEWSLEIHRGASHALLVAPLAALLATGVVSALFRGARARTVFPRMLLAVVAGHLLPDVWTGWGTRLLLPFSPERWSWDWTVVLDPFFTLPLLVAALLALRRRAQWRRALLVGLLVSCGYLSLRVGLKTALTTAVWAHYPEARRLNVFPSLLSVRTWRYAAELPDAQAVGTISAGDAPREESRLPLPTSPPQPFADKALVREALHWARYPLVRWTLDETRAELRIADMRYHLRGKSTLEMVFVFAPEGALREARLERGGDVKTLFQRWRGRDN